MSVEKLISAKSDLEKGVRKLTSHIPFNKRSFELDSCISAIRAEIRALERIIQKNIK